MILSRTTTDDRRPGDAYGFYLSMLKPSNAKLNLHWLFLETHHNREYNHFHRNGY